MIAVKGCPPEPKKVVEALHEAGIEADPNLFAQAESLPGFFMARYQDRPEFEESFFRVE
jgi:coenzyme F420-reducing hydrogenase gamma subunit